MSSEDVYWAFLATLILYFQQPVNTQQRQVRSLWKLTVMFDDTELWMHSFTSWPPFSYFFPFVFLTDLHSFPLITSNVQKEKCWDGVFTPQDTNQLREPNSFLIKILLLPNEKIEPTVCSSSSPGLLNGKLESIKALTLVVISKNRVPHLRNEARETAQMAAGGCIDRTPKTHQAVSVNASELSWIPRWLMTDLQLGNCRMSQKNKAFSALCNVSVVSQRHWWHSWIVHVWKLDLIDANWKVELEICATLS